MITITSELEKQFHDAMVNIYKQAKEECGYAPALFLKMVGELGGIETAKRLLRSKNTQYGFFELQRCNRLDLTMEAHVIKPEYAELFEAEEVREARERLTGFGYAFQDNVVAEKEDMDGLDIDSTVASNVVFEKFKAEMLFFSRLNGAGLPWRGVQEKIKEFLPEDVLDIEAMSYKLVPLVLSKLYGAQNVGWYVEKRSSKSGPGQTAWVVVNKKNSDAPF